MLKENEKILKKIGGMIMKKNIKRSVLLFMIIIFIGLIPNIIQAAELTVEETERMQNMLNVLPNEVSVDLKESECEKVPSILKDKVQTIWNEKNISLQGLCLNVHFGGELEEPASSDDTFPNPHLRSISYFTIELTPTTDSWHKERIKGKTIKVIYNNSANYNVEDEQAIQAAMNEIRFDWSFPPDLDLNFYSFDTPTDKIYSWYKMTDRYVMEKSVGDPTIKVIRLRSWIY